MDEKSRLAQLRNYRILDSEPDEDFDALTKLASSIFDAKISLISLVDENRQWFKSRIGLNITETERKHSFCSVAIEDKNNVMVVPNAKLDERFKNNPLVTGDPSIVFYAGAPVVDSEGYALGTICIIDSEEKEFTQKDILTLAALAKVVAEKIESKKLKNDLIKERKERDIIINSLPSLLFLKDTKNNILLVNETAAAAAGYSVEEMINKPTVDFFPLADQYYKADLEVIKSKQSKFGIEEEYITDKKEHLWIKTDKIPFLNENGEVESLLVVSSDITETKKLENKLLSEVSTKTKILNSAKLSIIATDKNGIVELFSKGAETLLGYDSTEVVGVQKLDFFHVKEEIESRASYLSQEFSITISPDFSLFAEKAKRGLSHSREWSYVRKDNTIVPVLLSITSIEDQNNEITGYLAIAKDISLEKIVERESKVREELEKKIVQAGNIAIRKNRFLANISHEIRTPLTTIISLSELLSEEKLPDGMVEDLNEIVSSAHHLNKMIGGILDFSKIESGQLPIIPVRTELKTFIRGISKSLQAFAENKNVKYEVDVIGVLPEFIEIDSTRVRQVIDNLTSNACKFTQSGGLVRLVIDVSEGVIDFSVIDTGAGIPESVVDTIFEPYFQIDGSLARQESGIGLGLAISKELASVMGGELKVISKLEVGSTFSFSVPYTKVVSHSVDKPKTCRLFLNRKILIADDNLVNRIAAVRILNSMGINTVEAKDGQEVLEAIDKEDFDLILLDIHMPKMDGLEVLKTLNVKETSRPPIAMLTACATNEERQNAFRLGAEGYIVKPFGRKAFEVELETLLTLQAVDQNIS